MAGTSQGAKSDPGAGETVAGRRTLAAVFSLATGVEFGGIGSSPEAVQKIAPLLENPSLLTTAIPLPRPVRQIAAIEEFRSQLENISKIGARVAELRQNAEIEGEPFSEVSDTDFRQFLARLPLRRRPSIFLLDNGDLSAVWDGPEKELVSLQFIGNGSIQYVMFRDSPTLESSSGVDAFDDVRARLDDFKHLI